MKKNYLLPRILITCIANAFIISTMATTIPISIYCPNFGSTYASNWTLNGNSTIVSNTLRLTDDITNQKATAFWTSKICNGDGLKFSAFFSFKIQKTTKQADGITFIIQQYANNFGSAGEGIGYLNLPGKSIAIEYDTYTNASQNDPDNGHIAVDINGVVNHNTNATFMGLPSSSMVVNKATLTGMGINLVDGNEKFTWIDFDGTNLQVRISTTNARPATPIINIVYDFEAYFDGTSTFYGFGSATGAEREKHFINSVYIHNRYMPIDFSTNTYEQGNFSTNSVTNINICEGQSYQFNNQTFTTDTTYIANLTNSVNCDSTATLNLYVSPLQTSWTGAVSSDWFDDANWNTKHPEGCSHVIIPDVGDGVRYPVIDEASACKSITFEAGGAVLGLQHLSYEKAYVDLKLQRMKWYTLTTPLKNMFSGDYYTTGRPKTQTKLFDDVNPDIEGDTVAVGTWTKSFANLMVPFAPGMGFAFYVDTLSYNYPYGITSNYSDHTLHFPRRNPNGSLIEWLSPYSGVTGKVYTNMAQSLPKDSLIAYRFAMENTSNVLEDVRVPIKTGLNLVGNPLMTHLDFNLLYASNEDKISNNVKFWNGTSFTTYMAGDDISSSMDLAYTKIPPMQAFFVYGREGIGEDTQLDINLNEHFVADTITKLRTAKVSTRKNLMHIKASLNGLDSWTAIALKTSAQNGFGEDDAFKLFSNNKTVPEVYTMADNNALDINQFANLPYMTPVGIKTDGKGIAMLEFFNPESFEGIDVTLLNTRTGEQQNLKASNRYTLFNDGKNTDGSLFVEFRNANSTSNIEEQNSCTGKCIQVYCENGTLFAYSPQSDKIKKIIIWEELGNQLYNNSNINTATFEIKLNTSSQICVCRVETEGRVYVVKVMMK